MKIIFYVFKKPYDIIHANGKLASLLTNIQTFLRGSNPECIQKLKHEKNEFVLNEQSSKVV